jgi:endonuclease/exonuclease/phosphatase (EEP) superfamily protein YafD
LTSNRQNQRSGNQAHKTGQEKLDRKERPGTLTRHQLLLFDAVGTIVSILSLLGLFGFAGWGFDIFSHFRLQYLLALFVCLLLSLKRSKVLLSVWSIFAFMNLLPVASLYMPAPAANLASPRLKLLSLNLNSISNRDYARAAACIRSFDPDLISLQEVNAAFGKYLTENLAAYKFNQLLTNEQYEGMGLLSKFPITKTAAYRFGKNCPVLSAVARTSLGDIQVLAVHPLPPYGWDWWRQEVLFFEALAGLCRERTNSFVVMGDFNATAYGYHLNHLKSITHLQDSCNGFGVQPTWPSGFAPMAIAIDHCLFSGDLLAVAHKVGPDISSDHLPLYVELSRKN